MLTTLLLAAPLVLAQDPLRICTDNGNWFPYTWIEDERPQGLHIHIVEAALAELGVEYEFQVRPWKRCLLYAQTGEMDVIASASFTKERSRYLFYPPDAGSGAESKWQITRASYVVVSLASDPYEFNGDLRTLPDPVRAVLGYSIVKDLREAGLRVYQDKNPMTMYRGLLQSGQGVVVGFEAVADHVTNIPEYRNQLKIHEPPVRSRPYYLPFSRRTGFDETQRMLIWERVARFAGTPDFVSGFFMQLKMTPEPE